MPKEQNPEYSNQLNGGGEFFSQKGTTALGRDAAEEGGIGNRLYSKMEFSPQGPEGGKEDCDPSRGGRGEFSGGESRVRDE